MGVGGRVQVRLMVAFSVSVRASVSTGLCERIKMTVTCSLRVDAVVGGCVPASVRVRVGASVRVGVRVRELGVVKVRVRLPRNTFSWAGAGIRCSRTTALRRAHVC